MRFTEKLYCGIHKAAKELLGRSIEPDIPFGYLYFKDDISRSDGAQQLYFGENEYLTTSSQKPLFKSGQVYATAPEAWLALVEESIVPHGWKNSGFCNVCYSKLVEQWCLSSWIWTSAAIARYAFDNGKDELGLSLADSFLREQQPCGGWIVRNDYINGNPAPMLAPNDSSYIANNALVSAYNKTGDDRYLSAAIRCADWIIDTALESGLVSTGFNVASGEWANNVIIVDTGFTAALFASLCELNCGEKYKQFLDSFTSAFIEAFRDPVSSAFATSVDSNGIRNTGLFARGQAWALEGLIPAYSVLRKREIKEAIEGAVLFLVESQSPDGGWAYNLAKPLLGQDCKGVSVIARSLMQWYLETGDSSLLEAVDKAIAWCKKHTDLEGQCPGGIFCYCMEGAVTHYLYSEAAFVYASSYALETTAILEKLCWRGDKRV